MSRSIAVFLNENGESSSFDSDGTIRTYLKGNNNWNVTNEKHFGISDTTNLNEVRNRFIKLAEDLEGCRVLVAREVTGIAYNILDSAGFNLWELEGEPLGFLDYVLEAEQKEEFEAEFEAESNTIKSLGNGRYYVNLRELQKTDSSISSKQAIIPILNYEDFYELEVVCTHMPPWFENEFQKTDLMHKISKTNEGEFKVLIYRKTCND